MASSGNQFRLWAARAAQAATTTLSALTLQNSTAASGVSGSTNIIGRTVGSTLTLTDTVGGIFSIDSATAVLSWTSSLANGSNTPTIRETLAGATNTPRDTSPTVTGTTGLVITDATGGASKFAGKIPVFRDAYVAMSTLVTQNDEAIDLQAVVGTPYSPLATTITVTGADIGLFDKYTGGKLVIKSSARATITKDTTYALTVNASNAAGSSEACTLYVYVAADADCRFVSFDKGTDATTGNIGKLPATPWKHCPNTTEWTGSTTTLASKIIFFEGVDLGAKHATTLCGAGYPTYGGADHTGTSGKRMRYCFTGWGGQAKFTGADDITGSWSAVSSGDIYSSGATGVEKIALASAPDWFNLVSFGEAQGFMSQYPRPNILTQATGWFDAYNNANNYDDTAGTSDGGFKRVRHSLATADAFTPRICTPGSSGMSFVEDAKLDVRFNNQDWALNSLGIGVWVHVNISGNNTIILPVLQYDLATHRAYFQRTTTNSADGTWDAYALLGSPYDVKVDKQYAFDAAGGYVIAKRPNSNQAVIAKRSVGIGIGGQAYTSYHQMWFERFVTGERKDGLNPNGTPATTHNGTGGCALFGYSSGAVAGCEVWGARSHQCFNGFESASLFHAPQGNAGFKDFMFDRWHMTECIRGAGIVGANPLLGLETGSTPLGGPTAAELMAYGKGKVRWLYFEDDCCSRSHVYLTKLRGVEFIEPVQGRMVTIHGDGWPWYRDVTGLYNDHNLVRDGVAVAFERWRTSSSIASYDHSISQYNTFLRTVVLGYNAGNSGIELYDGDPGALYQQCVFMADSTDTSDAICFHGYAGMANMTLLNCVANGVWMGTGNGGDGTPATWTLDNCYFTADSKLDATGVSIIADNAGASRRVLSCTRGTNKGDWDYVAVPSDWLTTLRKGASAGATKLGPFLYV